MIHIFWTMCWHLTIWVGRTVYGAEYLDRLASAFATLDIDATKWCTHYIMVHCIVVQIHKYKYNICDAKWCRANVAEC